MEYIGLFCFRVPLTIEVNVRLNKITYYKKGD